MAKDLNDLHRERGEDGARKIIFESLDGAAMVNRNRRNSRDHETEDSTKKVAEEILETISAAKLLEKPAPHRIWFVDPYIPHREVTLLSGDGGIGKSLLGLQLCGAAAAGREWMGIATRSCPSLYISCEDDEDELHFRLECLQKHEPMAKLDRLHIIDRAGKENILAAPDLRSGVLKTTPLFQAIEATVQKIGAGVLVLDAAADLYGGDENNRSQVRSFIQMLRGIALRNDCAVILLSHPSVDAMKNDRGYSGSTAWNASVRSRLYFSSLPIQDGETDTDARILELKKSNRAQRGLKLCLRWKNGVFVPEGTGEDAARKMEIGILAETIFLQLLDERNSQKRHVSDRPGANYAPAIFAEHPATKGLSKDQLKHAMERLFTSGRIKVDTIGPLSRQVRQIVRVSS